MDELKGIQLDTEIIPEGCLSFVEEASYIASAIDEDFDALVEEFADEPEDGEEEATDESVVISESKAGEIANKVVVWLQKIWGQIKKVFNDLIKWIDERVQEFKSKQLEKKLDKVANSKQLKSDAKLGKYHKGTAIGDTKWMGVLVVSDLKQIRADEFAADDLPAKVSKACGVNHGNEKIDVATMKKDMKEYFLGKDEIEVTGANFQKKIFADILKGSQKNDVKKAYNEARKTVNDYIKKIKGWNTTGEKTAAGDDIYAKTGENRSSKLKNTLNRLRRCSQLLSVGVGVQCDAIRTQNREAMSIVMAAARKGNKKDSVKESAEIFAW